MSEDARPVRVSFYPDGVTRLGAFRQLLEQEDSMKWSGLWKVLKTLAENAQLIQAILDQLKAKEAAEAKSHGQR